VAGDSTNLNLEPYSSLRFSKVRNNVEKYDLLFSNLQVNESKTKTLSYLCYLQTILQYFLIQ
jgi:hypothetical protein